MRNTRSRKFLQRRINCHFDILVVYSKLIGESTDARSHMEFETHRAISIMA
jgi:hypothetical protein